MKFPERLKKLRKDNNLLQDMLADVIGVSTSAISNYEQGTREPDFQTLIHIANHFRVTVDYLIGNDRIIHSKTVVVCRNNQFLYKGKLHNGGRKVTDFEALADTFFDIT